MTQAKRRKGYGAKLDDLDLLLAVAPDRDVQVQTIPPEATRVDTGQSPEDFVSEFGQTFSRAQFAGGEGLGFAHREDSQRNRFWDSRRVDVGLPEAGDRHAVKLALAAEMLNDTDESPTTDGKRLWVDRGLDGVYRSDDPLSDSPTFTDVSPPVAEVHDLAFLGDYIYVAAGLDGTYRSGDNGSSWTQWSDLDTTVIFPAKGRILGAGMFDSNANTEVYELYEVRSGANSVLVANANDPGAASVWWHKGFDAGSHILVPCDDGHVYALTVSDQSTAPSLESQTHIPFEEVQALTSIGGVVLLGTQKDVGSDDNARLWRGTLAGDGTIQELQLIREWESSPLGDDSLIHDGEAAYVGVGSTDPPGVWRYDLRSGGLSHYLDTSGGGTPTVGTIIGGRLFYDTGTELWRQGTVFETSGYLMTPAADFFTALDKSWLRITVDANVPTGDDGTDTKIEAYYATDLDAMDDPDSSLWTLAGTLTPSSTDDEFDLTDAHSRFIVLMVKLYSSDDQTATPELFSVSVTANVIGEEVSVTLPVNVSDRHERFGRRPVRRKPGTGKSLFHSLLDKRGKNVDLELYRHGLTVRGIVQEIQTPTQSITPRGSPTMYSLVTFRGTITAKS